MQENDILFSIAGAIGRTAVVTNAILPANTNQALAIIRIPKGTINYSFLLYILQSSAVHEQAEKKKQGVAQLNLSLKDVGDLIIPDIPLEQQQEIVNVLDKVNAIIALRKHQIEKLDEIVKVRFIEMFGMLDTNNKHWIQEPLGKVCDQIKRYPTFCNMEYIQSGVRVIRIGNILIDGHMDTNDENYVFVYEKANNDYPDTVIEENDIIMAVRGDGSTAKRIGIVTESKLIGANISPNLIRIKAKKELLVPLFLFYYLTGAVGQARLEAFVNKTAKKNIASKDIVKVLTPIPPLQLQKQFVDFVRQTDKSKIGIQKSLEKLETLKKALMQKYFG